jgi:hypothetical protein
MAIADHGGFDILIDVSPSLITRTIGRGLALPPISQPFTTPEASGTATVQLTASDVRLQPGNIIVVELSLAGSRIEVTSAEGFPTIPAALRTITLAGTVSIRDTLDASGLDAVIDTTANPGRGTPGITVTLDRDALLSSPLVVLLVARAFVLGGEEAAARTRETLVSTTTALLETQLRGVLGSVPIRQTLLSFPANLAPGTGVPDTRPPIVLSSPTGTLRIGTTLGGAPGNMGLISRSNLGSGDGIAFIVSNACLLRDLVRPLLDRRFGLTASGTFLPSDPFLWTGRAPIAIPGVGTAFMTNLSVFVDELQRVVLAFSVTASFAEGGISVHASLRVPAAIAVASGAGGLVATFTPAPAVVTSSRVDVEAWVYIAIAFGGGPLLVAALAAADAIADGEIAGPLATAVNGAISAITIPIPLPAGVPTLRVTGTSLFQADAPRRMLATFGFPMPAPGRDHDLVVRLA